MTNLKLLPVLLFLVACEKKVELSSMYCAEVWRGGADETLRESHFSAFDSLFDELRFQLDDHMGSRCVKSFWGHDSKATVNVCTDFTIVTTYGKNNVRNDELDQRLSDEVLRLFDADFAINDCAVPYGFSITGWPEVDSEI